MNLDAKICYCFHVTRRKLENFIKIENPKVASMLSQCGGAGTGCGWCVPFLKQLHAQANGGAPTDLDSLSAEEYATGREEHISKGKGTPPAP